MKDRKQWVCWRLDGVRGGKPTKVPVTIGGYGASTVEPSDWYSYADAIEAAHKFDGIGFVFTDNDPFVGIDLDNCLLDGGEIADWAVEILDRFAGSYAEISPSGNGIKIICEGSNPLPAGKRSMIADGAVELYDRGRFFTITADVWDGSTATDKQDAINWLASTRFIIPQPKPLALPSEIVGDGDAMARAEAYLQTMEPSISGSGGHDACYRAACKMVIGFNLTTEQAYSLLASVFNPKCQPPWSEKELWHKVNSANKEAGQRGGLLDSNRMSVLDGVDLSGILSPNVIDTLPSDEDIDDDEQFLAGMVPDDGLLRGIFDYYWDTKLTRSNCIGLAIAVSFCEAIFGRRIKSHTGIRTNDYNIVVAPTVSGKEACKEVMLSLSEAGIAAGNLPPDFQILIPGGLQSGNGLMSEVAAMRCGICVCDEFGEYLESILDTKKGNAHTKKIGTNLLDLYGASSSQYLGDAHSGGRRNTIVQPHFCLLGMSTHDIFDAVTEKAIHGGLLNRMAFWPLQNRPPLHFPDQIDSTVPSELAERIGQWFAWQPGFDGEFPQPVTLDMEPGPKLRWETHAVDIRRRMDTEAGMRSALWGRSAARAMKLAMVHCAARMISVPSSLEDFPVTIEDQDIEWGIKLSNWLTRAACDLIAESVHDSRGGMVARLIMELVERGPVTRRQIARKHRRLSAAEIAAAAESLESSGAICIDRTMSKGASGTEIATYSLPHR